MRSKRHSSGSLGYLSVLSQEDSVASPFFSLKYPGKTQEVGDFVLLLGIGCGEGAGCRAGAGPGFRFFLFCLQIIIKIEILNSIKNKSTR